MTRRGPTSGAGSVCEADGRTSPRVPLGRAVLSDHIDIMYRAAYGLCGSRHDAEDLVQETFVRVLKRERLVHRGHEPLLVCVAGAIPPESREPRPPPRLADGCGRSS